MRNNRNRALKSPAINRPLGWSSHGWTIATPGRFIYTSGYTARDDTGEVLHLGDAANQTRQICENLKLILAQDGASLEHVVKVIVYLVNRADFDAVQEARREYFPTDPPASTTILVAGLIDPKTLVEVEAVAFVPE